MTRPSPVPTRDRVLHAECGSFTRSGADDATVSDATTPGAAAEQPGLFVNFTTTVVLFGTAMGAGISTAASVTWLGFAGPIPEIAGLLAALAAAVAVLYGYYRLFQAEDAPARTATSSGSDADVVGGGQYRRK